MVTKYACTISSPYTKEKAARFINNDYFNFFQRYGYDAGSRMVHIRREEMGYKSDYIRSLINAV